MTKVESVHAHWAGAFDVVQDVEGWQEFRRLDTELLMPPFTDGLADMAQMTAGIRATWTASSGRLTLKAEGTADCSPIDVLVDGQLAHRIPAAGRLSHTLELGTLPAGAKVQLWLPQFGRVRVLDASLQGEDVQSVQEPGKRWLAYGSSITHCREAAGPSETWPALVARKLGWELQSLGFAGECQLDPAAARTIQRLPADVISLCLGINSYNAAAFSLRSYASQVLGFISNILTAHPDVPLVVITPVLSLPREATHNAVGATLADYREATAGVVAHLQRRSGEARIHLVDGRAVLTEAEALAHMPDTLHPDNAGYRLMAERLGPRLAAAAANGPKD